MAIDHYDSKNADNDFGDHKTLRKYMEYGRVPQRPPKNPKRVAFGELPSRPPQSGNRQAQPNISEGGEPPQDTITLDNNFVTARVEERRASEEGARATPPKRRRALGRLADVCSGGCGSNYWRKTRDRAATTKAGQVVRVALLVAELMAVSIAIYCIIGAADLVVIK
ncbi:hypothetical protein EV182_007916, partial [Spiromyces aspiralis]